MDRVWPVKEIQLGEPINGIWGNIQALVESGEVFILEYIANDDKSGYIHFKSFDGENRTLVSILQRYGLRLLVPYITKSELLLMW